MFNSCFEILNHVEYTRRQIYTTRMRNVQLLKEDSVDEFRNRAFQPAIPVVSSKPLLKPTWSKVLVRSGRAQSHSGATFKHLERPLSR